MSIIKKGDKYNKLVAIKFSHRDVKSNQYWLFRCDCGKEKIICVSYVKRNSPKSCGCLRHKMTHSKTYKSWAEMKYRCLNKNNKGYKYYGGRGITVCKEWLDFENFYRDMGDKPEGKSIDRRDNNGNYCKENCRWATPKEQCNNRRNNYFITCKNETKTVSQWSEKLNIKYATIYSRNRKGWSSYKTLYCNKINEKI